MKWALRVCDLTVRYRLRSSIFSRTRILTAVDKISFEIAEGETLGLVGESGSGKSTTARAVLALESTRTGSVTLLGTDIDAVSRRELRRLRANAQMVFQDPYSSLDPSMTIGQTLEEALIIHTKLDARKRRERAREAIEAVGLSPAHLSRHPSEFSGGQRQRIAIARAMILQPALIVCDEPVSALDVSTQGAVLNLLARVQKRIHCAYLFVAHDIGVVRAFSDRMAVMYLGRIVETGPSDRVCSSPGHPYTAALMSSVRYTDPRPSVRRRRAVLSGEVPSPMNPPMGCHFSSRCPFAMDICRIERPQPFPMRGGGEAACHLHTHGPKLNGAPVPPFPAHGGKP